MMTVKRWRYAATVLVAGSALFAAACTSHSAARTLEANAKTALAQADLKDVTVNVDDAKGVVQLGGKVGSEDSKQRAEQAVKAVAGTWIVANEISDEPPGGEDRARAVASDLDQAIEKNYKAALLSGHLDGQKIDFRVKNQVVTLTGSVADAGQRNLAEQLAGTVPNVLQVVNELTIKSGQ